MVEEKFEFTANNKKNIFIVLGVGLLLAVLGIILLNMGGGHHEAGAAAEEGAHAFHWTKRLWANIWLNNVFFAGIALVGVLFFAIQYAAQAGWSVGIKRIPLAFGAWIPVAFVLMIITFFVAGHDLFHWTHHDLYVEDTGDSIIQGKAGYFYWPLEGGTFPFFYILRMVVFFAVWYLMYVRLKNLAFAEDLEGGVEKWYKIRSLSAFFIVFFAISSSIAAWDWVMSIDPHWFSTMMGWYNFASWWVAGLALIALIVVSLQDRGYLTIVNSNHVHNLALYIFAFSVFWTYIWFSQFFLIYYANIPEESIYFVERWKSDHYAPLFYLNLIINFFFPFLVLMTRQSKRHARFIKVVAPIVIFGHWLDFYMMIMPGTLRENSGIGFLELGILMIYSGAFIFVVLTQLAKAPLYGKNHPMLQESIHHHI